MLQSNMRRFFALFLFCSALGAFAQSPLPGPVTGLIVQLKPNAQAGLSRELLSAAVAQRESLASARLETISQATGVRKFTHRHLSGDHRVLRFAQPLQGHDLEDTMRRLRLHPDVAAVEPDVRVPLAQTPNDTRFPEQWHLGSRLLAASALEMTSTWAVTTGSAAVTIAVLDTGVVRSHPDLQALGTRLLQGYDFIDEVDFAGDGSGRDGDPSDPGDFVTAAEANATAFRQVGCVTTSSSWHGTFIAGQIAAATNNNEGVAGLNWNAQLLPVRVSGKCGAQLSDILDGMRWAAGLSVQGVPDNPNPAKIINLSFGGDQACTASYQTVIDELAARGSLVVVAAGNGSGGQSRQLRRPADCRGVLTVGSVQRDGAKTAYSFVGSNVAVMAPGGHSSANNSLTMVLSASNAGLQDPAAHIYGLKQGTSFSAPLAAGVASLMLAVNPQLSPDALIARIKNTSHPHVSGGAYASCDINDTVACLCTTSKCGAGILNPLAAVLDAIKPAALIAPVTVQLPGASVVLDGRSSAAVSPENISAYTWSQLSGPAVSIPNSNTSVTQIVLGSSAAVYEFQLSVTDTLGRVGQAWLRVEASTEAKQLGVGATGGSSSGGGAGHWLWVATLMALFIAAWVQRRRARLG
jgi:serine protease